MMIILNEYTVANTIQQLQQLRYKDVYLLIQELQDALNNPQQIATSLAPIQPTEDEEYYYDDKKIGFRSTRYNKPDKSKDNEITWNNN